MKRQLRRRSWLELGLFALSTLVLALTFVWHDWIEVILGIEPDGVNGAAEWLIVLALFALTFAFAFAARNGWRRSMASA